MDLLVPILHLSRLVFARHARTHHTDLAPGNCTWRVEIGEIGIDSAGTAAKDLWRYHCEKYLTLEWDPSCLATGTDLLVLSSPMVQTHLGVDCKCSAKSGSFAIASATLRIVDLVKPRRHGRRGILAVSRKRDRQTVFVFVHEIHAHYHIRERRFGRRSFLISGGAPCSSSTRTASVPGPTSSLMQRRVAILVPQHPPLLHVPQATQRHRTHSRIIHASNRGCPTPLHPRCLHVMRHAPSSTRATSSPPVRIQLPYAVVFHHCLGRLPLPHTIPGTPRPQRVHTLQPTTTAPARIHLDCSNSLPPPPTCSSTRQVALRRCPPQLSIEFSLRPSSACILQD